MTLVAHLRFVPSAAYCIAWNLITSLQQVWPCGHNLRADWQQHTSVPLLTSGANAALSSVITYMAVIGLQLQ